jgi:hypothetical protein
VTVVELDGPIDLQRTLAFARMGMGDPSLRIVDGDVWRATRTPLGLATQRLHKVRADAVSVDVWGPGADWLLERASSLCGALDRPETFRPEQPLLHGLTRRHPGLRIGRTEAVFETALFVTVEQRVATRDAWNSWRLLVRALGEPAPGLWPGCGRRRRQNASHGRRTRCSTASMSSGAARTCSNAWLSSRGAWRKP